MRPFLLGWFLLLTLEGMVASAPPENEAFRAGKGDFTITFRTDGRTGTWLRAYDTSKRQGWHVSLVTQAVTSSQANHRQLQFGVDDDRPGKWEDCGRPGNALLAFALTSHQGQLFAGTCEPGKDEAGHVYRYAGGQQWTDLGSPDRSNSVTSLAAYRGQLYAGTGKYRVAGSALAESENTTLGGRIFRYDGVNRWIDCGQLPNTEAIGGLIVFRDRLYASSLYKPAGFYRYVDGQRWEDMGTPDGKRVVALAVHDDQLYATSYDGGRVYRFDGKSWSDLGQLGDNTQTYSFATYNGELYVGTWPSGRVYRRTANGWFDTGRLGEELEVMGMLVHNQRLIAGTLPLAEVYQYDGPNQWRKLTRLDSTPNVKYRRAWTMAEHNGRVFTSTLPSGRVWSWEAGRSISWDQLPAGAHHVAIVRRGAKIEWYVDGKFISESNGSIADYDLGEHRLEIGAGVSDVKWVHRALPRTELLKP